MDYQPVNIIETGVQNNFQVEGSTMEFCPDNLTVFDIEKVPNFYVLSDVEIISNVVIKYFDCNGSEVHFVVVNNLNLKKAKTAQGFYYFFNDIDSNFSTCGDYQISVCHTGDLDEGTTQFCTILDFARFVNNPDDCYVKMEFLANCNYNGIPFVRCPDFKFLFWFPKNTNVFKSNPTFEEEVEENSRGENIAVSKKLVISENVRVLNISRCLVNSIVYGATFDESFIGYEDQRDQTILNIEFEEPIGTLCCVLSLIHI